MAAAQAIRIVRWDPGGRSKPGATKGPTGATMGRTETRDVDPVAEAPVGGQGEAIGALCRAGGSLKSADPGAAGYVASMTGWGAGAASRTW
jgi:hypothetical protein